MKTKYILSATILGITSIAFLSLCSFGGGNTTQADDGQASACGSPGEPGTCSRSTCHGAGNGNNSTGGLPDNAGPGSISFTTSPAMLWNNYVPGATYTFNVTIAETGKPRFGFAVEMLDNSGNTNTHTNNTVGTLIVSDPTNTRTWQAFGTGRLALTHKTGAGYTTSSHTYQFQWTAPLTGIVNMYLAGNAANNDLFPDAGDNVYTLTQQFFPLTLGVTSYSSTTFGMNVFPNPIHDAFTLSFDVKEEKNISAEIYSLDGKLVEELINNHFAVGHFSENYSVNDLAKGIYILKISDGEKLETKKIIVE